MSLHPGSLEALRVARPEAVDLGMINLTGRRATARLNVGGDSHEPAQPDLVATAATPAATRRHSGFAGLSSHARRAGVRPWPIRHRHRPNARGDPTDCLQLDRGLYSRSRPRRARGRAREGAAHDPGRGPGGPDRRTPLRLAAGLRPPALQLDGTAAPPGPRGRHRPAVLGGHPPAGAAPAGFRLEEAAL
jgi:hypothetical protein